MTVVGVGLDPGFVLDDELDWELKEMLKEEVNPGLV